MEDQTKNRDQMCFSNSANSLVAGLNAIVALVLFLAALMIVGRWLGTIWRAGRLSTRPASLVIAVLWGAFPFVGLLGGAPWSIPVVVLVSLIMFVGVFVSGEILLPRLAKPPG